MSLPWIPSKQSGSKTKFRDIYVSYSAWAIENKFRLLSQKSLGDLLSNLPGVTKEHKRDGNWYYGITLPESGGPPIGPSGLPIIRSDLT